MCGGWHETVPTSPRPLRTNDDVEAISAAQLHGLLFCGVQGMAVWLLLDV
jgi:hypothetical protein